MPLTVTYDNPSYLKGEEMALKGLGIIPNGGSVELTEVQELEFLAEYGHTVREHVDGYKTTRVNNQTGEEEEVDVAGDENIKVTGSALVPPRQAAKIAAVPVTTGPSTTSEDGGDT